MDPFAGSGVTLIEAARLDRQFIGADINPHAVDIICAKIQAIQETNDSWYLEERLKIEHTSSINNIQEYCESSGIDVSVTRWYEEKTLSELISLHSYVSKNEQEDCSLLRRILFSSILNRACSQRDHYTYITDNCYPTQMVYKPAIQMFLEQLDLTAKAASEWRTQFDELYGRSSALGNVGVIKCCDSRSLDWISSNEIDLVVTSPPYLGVNDYVRSMRLTTLFYPENGIDAAIASEIGARRKRKRKEAFGEYIEDMKLSFSEIARILKPGSFLCLVLGKGQGRVNREDPINILVDVLKNDHGFTLDCEIERKIKFRRIQVAGVGTEKILVLSQKE